MNELNIYKIKFEAKIFILKGVANYLDKFPEHLKSNLFYLVENYIDLHHLDKFYLNKVFL